MGKLLEIPRSPSSAPPARAAVCISGTAGTSVGLGVRTAVIGDVWVRKPSQGNCYYVCPSTCPPGTWVSVVQLCECGLLRSSAGVIKKLFSNNGTGTLQSEWTPAANNWDQPTNMYLPNIDPAHGVQVAQGAVLQLSRVRGKIYSLPRLEQPSLMRMWG